MGGGGRGGIIILDPTSHPLSSSLSNLINQDLDFYNLLISSPQWSAHINSLIILENNLTIVYLVFHISTKTSIYKILWPIIVEINSASPNILYSTFGQITSIACLKSIWSSFIWIALCFQTILCYHQPPLKTVTCDTKRSYSWQCIVYQTSQAIKEEIIKFDVINLWLVCADLWSWRPGFHLIM